MTVYLGERFHHLRWSTFLCLEYIEFGGMEMILDTKFNLIQVPVVFNIYPGKVAKTPYIYQLTP